MRRQHQALPISLFAVTLLFACAAPPPTAFGGDGPGDPALAARAPRELVRDLPRSARGNPPSYVVFGRRYRVLDSADGYRETGIASWYGSGFHGRPTSSGEPYDMHAMTAAHRHLPLPTFVRVENLDNNRGVIVKVNDRGPFVDDRLIDLSYAAAAALDILDSGTARVSVEALSREAPAAALTDGGSAGERYIQAGAFRERHNARALLERLNAQPGLEAELAESASGNLYRVRVGPFADSRELEGALTALQALGIDGYVL